MTHNVSNTLNITNLIYILLVLVVIVRFCTVISTNNPITKTSIDTKRGKNLLLVKKKKSVRQHSNRVYINSIEKPEERAALLSE